MLSNAKTVKRNADRTELDLDELMAARPLRASGPLAFGHRLPGGERIGRVRAQGADFESISPYVPGDDVRHIDWRSTARTGRTQMRRFSASAHRARCIVLDLKPELQFGTQNWFMLKTSLLAAAWLAWEARLLNEPVGLAIGTETELMQPRSGERYVERLMKRLWHCNKEISDFEPVPLGPLLERAAASLGQGDDLCLISDYPKMDSTFCHASRALAERRNLTIVIVEDPMFRSPTRSGNYPVRSGESRETISISERDSQNALNTLENLRRERRRDLLGCGWGVVEAQDLPLVRRSYQ